MEAKKTNVGGAQRTSRWDLEEYERRAKERAENDGEDPSRDGDVDSRPMRDREEFQRADVGMAGPAGSSRAFVQQRKTNLNLASAVGKTQVITDNGLRQKGGGWFCDVCDCLLKDSANYLDHINGKKHQRALGFSMRVERSTLCQVTSRFDQAKKRKKERSVGGSGPSAIEAYEQRLAEQHSEDDRRKRAKKEAKQAKKEEAEALEMEGMDPEMMAMMGFGGFGGGAKNRRRTLYEPCTEHRTSYVTAVHEQRANGKLRTPNNGRTSNYRQIRRNNFEC
jgi:U4/U6.U5 tri-snRNP component SNU23